MRRIKIKNIYFDFFVTSFAFLRLPISFVTSLKGRVGGISVNSTWSSSERLGLTPGGKGEEEVDAPVSELFGTVGGGARILELGEEPGSGLKIPERLPPRAWYSWSDNKIAVANRQASKVLCFITSFFHPTAKIPTVFCREPVRNERGFSLVEVMIAAGSALVLALALAVVQSSRSRGNALLSSGASNTSLSEALRMQLSRRETCLSSLTQLPSSFTGQSEIAVRLGNTAASDVVVAGANLKNWKVKVASLSAKNFSSYGNLSNGNAVYIGDIYLRSDSPELDTGAKMHFKEVLVSRLAFEMSGGNLAACYADDASTDSMQQLEQVCNLTTSSDGTPATWTGGRCVIPDNSTYTTCQSLGGNWNGSACSFSMTTSILSKSFADGDNVTNNLTCPSGYITGGACAWYGTPTQIGTMYIGPEGTLFSCSGANWSVGNTYRISVVCAQ